MRLSTPMGLHFDDDLLGDWRRRYACTSLRWRRSSTGSMTCRHRCSGHGSCSRSSCSDLPPAVTSAAPWMPTPQPPSQPPLPPLLPDLFVSQQPPFDDADALGT